MNMNTIITAIISLASGFLGAWLASLIALSRFRKERAFDRQLDWHEKMLSALHDMAQRIEIALTFQSEPQTDPEHLIKVWRDVQRAHLTIERVTQNALLYGSPGARQKAFEIMEAVQDVANETGGFDPPSLPHKDTAKAIELIESLPQVLRDSAEPIGAEARRHLGMVALR